MSIDWVESSRRLRAMAENLGANTITDDDLDVLETLIKAPTSPRTDAENTEDCAITNELRWHIAFVLALEHPKYLELNQELIKSTNQWPVGNDINARIAGLRRLVAVHNLYPNRPLGGAGTPAETRRLIDQECLALLNESLDGDQHHAVTLLQALMRLGYDDLTTLLAADAIVANDPTSRLGVALKAAAALNLGLVDVAHATLCEFDANTTPAPMRWVSRTEANQHAWLEAIRIETAVARGENELVAAALLGAWIGERPEFADVQHYRRQAGGTNSYLWFLFPLESSVISCLVTPDDAVQVDTWDRPGLIDDLRWFQDVIPFRLADETPDQAGLRALNASASADASMLGAIASVGSALIPATLIETLRTADEAVPVVWCPSREASLLPLALVPIDDEGTRVVDRSLISIGPPMSTPTNTDNGPTHRFRRAVSILPPGSENIEPIGPMIAARFPGAESIAEHRLQPGNLARLIADNEPDEFILVEAHGHHGVRATENAWGWQLGSSTLTGTQIDKTAGGIIAYACATAGYDQATGGGWEGLAPGLISKGAQWVIAPTWPVPAGSTSFIDALVGQLQQQPPREALAKVQAQTTNPARTDPLTEADQQPFVAASWVAMGWFGDRPEATV